VLVPPHYFAGMLITEAQAATEAQVDKRTVRRLIETGRLKAIDFGSKRRHYRIDPEDLKSISAAPDGQAPEPLPPAVRRRGRLMALPKSVTAALPSV
jgi:excisionase family DNA binding protein